MEVLSKHRGGLNAIARALLDNEIIDGAEVARLVDEAHGSPVHDRGGQVGPALPRGGDQRAGGHCQRRQRGQRPRVRTLEPGPTPPAVRSRCRPHPAAQATQRPEGESWPPPAWPPPADPAGGAPEGPAAR